MNDSVCNARFWSWMNGHPVKITLRPGQTLTWSKWQRTDEGWDAFSSTWSHVGDGVRYEWCNDGVDCDERLRQGGEAFAALEGLRAGNEVEGITYPHWARRNTWQRDYQAEAAGY